MGCYTLLFSALKKGREPSELGNEAGADSTRGVLLEDQMLLKEQRGCCVIHQDQGLSCLHWIQVGFLFSHGTSCSKQLVCSWMKLRAGSNFTHGVLKISTHSMRWRNDGELHNYYLGNSAHFNSFGFLAILIFNWNPPQISFW